MEAFPRPDAIQFTADGTGLMVGTEGDGATVFDVATGLPRIELPGGITENIEQDSSSGRVYTSHPDGAVRVWDADSAAFGLEVLADLGSASWVNGDGFSPGGEYTAVWHIDIPRQSYTSFFDPATGLFVGDPIETLGRAVRRHADPDHRSPEPGSSGDGAPDRRSGGLLDG